MLFIYACEYTETRACNYRPTHGSMTFRLTRLFTGRGRDHFHRIGRAPSPRCSHCEFPGEENEEHEDALRTLMRCDASDGEMERLVRTGRLGVAPAGVSRPTESGGRLHRSGSWRRRSRQSGNANP